MGDWCGAFDSDTKDYDITGAMFVTGDGNDIIRMPFYGQGLFWGFDTGWLMGDPVGSLWHFTLTPLAHPAGSSNILVGV